MASDTPELWTAEQREHGLLGGLRDSFADLTHFEESLVRAAARDQWFQSDPGEPRLELRGAVVDWLLSVPAAVELMPRRRLRLRRLAVIDGIDLTEAQTGATAWLDDVLVLGDIDLKDTRLGSLVITGSEIGAEGDRGTVDLTRCALRGVLRLERSHCRALLLDDATIGGSLSCRGSTFVNPGSIALSGEGGQISGEVVLDEGAFEGQVRLFGATIGGSLYCRGSTFTNPGGNALSADRANVAGSVFLDKKARFEGEVRLLATKIGGQLTCNGSTFTNPGDIALSATRANVAGGVFMRGEARFEGEVRLLGATIGGLTCSGSTFNNPKDDALAVHGTDITGNVFLDEKARFEGEVRLLGTTIGGRLDCRGSTFTNENGIALSAPGARIGQQTYLMPAAYIGNVGLHGASLTGGLWLPCGAGDKSFVFDLIDSEVSTIHLGDTSARLDLTGATYRRIQPLETATRSIVDRLLGQWDTNPQVPAATYEHLAAALRGAGQEPLAREVMVRRHDRRAGETRDGARGALARLALSIFKKAMRYGYSPFRPLAIALAAAVVGTTIMLYATYSGVVESPHQTWRVLGSTITGVAALIPLDTLFLEPTRAALAHPSTWQRIVYNIAWGCYWFESVLGWVLATISVAGLANIIRRV